jgi:hypothetical protein
MTGEEVSCQYSVRTLREILSRKKLAASDNCWAYPRVYGAPEHYFTHPSCFFCALSTGC